MFECLTIFFHQYKPYKFQLFNFTSIFALNITNEKLKNIRYEK